MTPSNSPTSSCVAIGGCIPLNSSTITCCSGFCRLQDDNNCGYECVDNSTNNSSVECIIFNPTPSPSTFPPTSSICIRGGECMIPNSTCCSNKCHRAKTTCLYGYSCNEQTNIFSEDDDIINTIIETNDYCLDHLNVIDIDDDNTNEKYSAIWAEIGIYIFAAIIFILIPCIYIIRRIHKSDNINFVWYHNTNDQDENNNLVVTDDGYVFMNHQDTTDIPFAQSEPITLDYEPPHTILENITDVNNVDDDDHNNILIASSETISCEDVNESMNELPRAEVSEVAVPMFIPTGV